MNFKVKVIYQKSDPTVFPYTCLRDATDHVTRILKEFQETGSRISATVDGETTKYKAKVGKHTVIEVHLYPNHDHYVIVDLDDSERNVPLTASDEAYNDFGRPLGWKQW